MFLNQGGDLRSGWKFLVYLVLLIVLYIATAIVLSVVYSTMALEDTTLTLLGLNAAALFAPAVLAMVLMARLIDHVPVSAFGVAIHDRWARDVLLGIGIATGMLALLLAGSSAFGELNMEWTADESSASTLLITVLLLLVSAANEELVFRGYPMQVLMRGVGPWPAMIFMSAIFGAMHMTNPNASKLGTLNTVLAGIMLSLAYLKTRSLWLPYGLHVGWNVGLGVVFGFPLSGIDIDSFWTARVGGPEQILGGEYGPEGGLLGTLIFIAAAVTVHIARGATVSPQIRTALESSAGKLYLSETKS